MAFHCRVCATRIAFIEHLIVSYVNFRAAVFTDVFNVQVPDDVTYHRVVQGKTVADTSCAHCGMLLGVKLIAVPQPSMHIREGIFYMKLQKLIYWNDEQGPNNQNGGANGQNGDANDQNGDANVQNADQDGGANEKNDDQD